jgi:peptidoglycan/LPS O-acetylase OafA/YrhL
MTATIPTARRARVRRAAPVLRTGVPVVLLAGVATTAVAAAGRAVGISLAMAGEPIPVLGFGTLTVVFGLVGVLLALAVSRWSRHPRRTFVTTTVVLTALSLVPDALADVAGSTRALLMTTHLVAASIIVPSLARRLPPENADRTDPAGMR